MATHTLTGDIGNLIGADLTNSRTPPRAWLVPFTPAVVEGGEVRIGSIELDVDAGGVFEQTEIPTGGYRVEVRYYDPDRRQLGRWTTAYFAISADVDLAAMVTAEPFEESLRTLSIGTVTSGLTPSVTLDSDGKLNFVLPDEGGAGNVLFEDAGDYPDRALEDMSAIFIGALDPGPDGLDIMVDGDVWLDTMGIDDLQAHLDDTSDAHDASAISFTPHGSLASTNVQAAIQELLDELAASGIPFTPAGTIAATNVQAAIVEVAAEAAGGGISPTTKIVDLPMTTLTDWSGAGTGASWGLTGAGSTIRDAAAAANNVHTLTYQIPVPLDDVTIECEIMVNSSNNTASSRAGFVFSDGIAAAQVTLLAGVSGFVSAVDYEYASTTAIGNYALGANIAHGTWITFRVRKSGSSVSAWVNGTFIGSADINIAHSKRRLFSLYTYAANASFRNLKVWVPTAP